MKWDEMIAREWVETWMKDTGYSTLRIACHAGMVTKALIAFSKREE